jgi:hypothetical protein
VSVLCQRKQQEEGEVERATDLLIFGYEALSALPVASIPFAIVVCLIPMAQPPPLPLQLPGPGAPTAAAHLTFASYYGDLELDPCKGDYRRIMERFDPDINNVVTPLLLQEQAVASGIVP